MEITLVDLINEKYENIYNCEELEIKNEYQNANDENVYKLPDIFDKFKNLKHLYISNSGHGDLEIVPSIFNNTNLESLDFGYKTKVSKEVCKLVKNAKSLKYLEFGYSKIEGEIEFENLENLETLRLSHENEINNLKENLQNIFKNENIKFLEVGDSTFNKENIEYLHIDYFENINKMVSLEKLIINSDELENLHNDIVNLNKLERLEIQAKSFNENVCKMTSLKELVVKGYFDNSITGEIGNMESLEVLDLGYAKSLPEEIGKLKSLKSLTCTNQLESLPKTFKNLDSLTKLVINSTRINMDDLEYIGQLKNLENLDCQYMHSGKLKEVPTFIRNLKKLKVLNISMQKFEEIPEWLAELENLEAINISHTNIKELPDFFVKFKNLREINIKYTQKMKSISPNIADIKTLRILHKDFVKTKKIMKVIESCTGLEQLYLPYFESKDYPNFELMENLKVLEITNGLCYKYKGDELQAEVNKLKFPLSLEHLVIEKAVIDLMPENIQSKYTDGLISNYSKSAFLKGL